MICPLCASVDTVELSDGVRIRCYSCGHVGDPETHALRLPRPARPGPEFDAECHELCDLLALLGYDPDDPDSLEQCLGDHDIYWSNVRQEWVSDFQDAIVDRLEAMREIAANELEARLPLFRIRFGPRLIMSLPDSPTADLGWEITRDIDQALTFGTREEAELWRPPNKSYVVEEVAS